MAPSRKRKRKPYPKRACPCCQAILSEKTIERHLGGNHVPNRIKVIRAAASSHNHGGPPHKTNSLSDSSSDDSTGSDLSSDLSTVFSDSSDDEEAQLDGLEIQGGSFIPPINPPINDLENINPPFDDLENINDRSDNGMDKPDLAEIIKETWSGRRSKMDHLDSDTDADDSLAHQNDESDSDSDLEWKEPGMRNGLDIDDLVNEDFQRIIAEFGVYPISYCFYYKSHNTIIIQRKSFPKRTWTCSGRFR
jgi:hypothetical protein